MGFRSTKHHALDLNNVFFGRESAPHTCGHASLPLSGGSAQVRIMAVMSVAMFISNGDNFRSSCRDQARSHGNATTSWICVLFNKVMSNRSKPKATPQQAGKPCRMAASNRELSGKSDLPNCTRAALLV